MKEIKNNKDELIILLRGLNRLIRFNMSWDFKRKDWQKSIEWRMKMTNKNEWKKLADKYLQQDKEQTIKVWNKIEELDLDSAEKLLNTPELVKLYINKYGINGNLKKVIINFSSNWIKYKIIAFLY